VANAPARPEVVTDLSKLSDASTTALPPPDQPSPAPEDSSGNEPIGHQLAANAPNTRWNVTPSNFKGGSRLLNDKARQFADFTDILLDQTLKAAQTMAPDKLSQHRVPEGLVPTTLTAVMDSDGRLKEIIIDQHSGDLQVDQLFIEACKKGIWSRNPPPGARDSDGKYRLRVEGTVNNQSYDRYGQYSYDTELGMGIL
jgi:hypothetical protein